MTPRLSFHILGCPVGKGRPRVTASRGVYTPKRTVAYERSVRLFAADALAQAGLTPFTGFVGAHFRFVFEHPKSWSEKRKRETRWCVGRTDVDNLVKAVADAMNGICYADDRQIVTLAASKEYGNAPGIFVQLWEIHS